MRLRLTLILVATTAWAQPTNIEIEEVSKGHQFLNAPVWSLEDVLLFADTPTDRMLRYTPGKGVTEDEVRAGGIAAITFDTKEAKYVTEPHARRVTRTDKKGKTDVLAERFEGKRLNGPNDIVVRRDGNVYFTDPAFGSQQDSRELDFYGVYRITSRGELSAIARWTTRPNGIALTEDGRTLYVVNADEQTVHAFDLDRNGNASNDRVVVKNINGAPSGVRVDYDGNIYVAARHVFVYAASGELRNTVEFAEPVSNLAFGDPDFRTLYVTSRGALYRVHVETRGTVSYLP